MNGCAWLVLFVFVLGILLGAYIQLAVITLEEGE